MKKLLLATTNAGKVAELSTMLANLPIEIVSLSSFDQIREVEETGNTFAYNAQLKAAGYALQTGLWTIADDSGLEVAALDGRPGVLSARYGGEDMPFAQKIEKLLGEIAASNSPDRSARFVCSIAIADPDGHIVEEAIGSCNGLIAPISRGSQGFGYDPIFVPEGHERTFGEMGEEEKRHLSHRGRSFSQIIPFLRRFSVV